jgi:hypothetical protein
MTAHTLAVAIRALEAISDPAKSSMRKRDPNCVRYIASDALGELEQHRDLRGRLGGIRWDRHDTVGGNIAGEPVTRDPMMPLCPVCGAASVEGKVQQVSSYPEGMAQMTVRAGVVAYRCEEGHWHDGERETGPLPDDVVIRRM